jgi:hypothetical protein
VQSDSLYGYDVTQLTGAALRIFEALEMWDALIVCYRLLEKKSLAEEVVRRRLKVDDSRDRQDWDIQKPKCQHISRHISSICTGQAMQKTSKWVGV